MMKNEKETGVGIPVVSNRGDSKQYSSTKDEEKGMIKIGDTWYARRPGATALTELKITDITPMTIEVMSRGLPSTRERYKIGEIEFIEFAKGEGHER